MEAVAAFGLAANICQFVDYGLKILAEAKRLRNSGSSNPELERNARHMKRLASKLDSRQMSSSLLSEEDALDAIAAECLSLSNDILTILETLKSTSKSKISSVFLALRNERRKKEVCALEEKLDQCRLQLQTQLVDMTRGEMHEKFNQLLGSDQQLKRSVLALEGTIRDLQVSLEAKSVNQMALDHLRDMLKSYNNAMLRMQQNTILGALQFPMMGERFDDVRTADEATFKWIFDDRTLDKYVEERAVDETSEENGVLESKGEGASGASSRPKYHETPELEEARRRYHAKKVLVDWLENGAGIFYISGKPGAGKSTLMKYLCCHKQTINHLHRWAGDQKLNFAKFFFWKPDKTQNSWKSLIRCLLCQILTSSPDLIPIAFPGKWTAVQSQPDIPLILEYRDIRQAFDNVLTQKHSLLAGQKLVFFIDGLDELEGNHSEMARTLTEWVRANQPNIKMCVSSREWNVFREAFTACPQFKIHEVTEDDIAKLVSSKVESNKHWQALGGTLSSLFGDIIAKAEGVFLWVSMVLTTVEEALLNGDGLLEIERKIDACPAGLEELFHYLLKSIHPCDRKWAFSALEITKTYKVGDYSGMSLSQFPFLDDYCHDSDFMMKQLNTYTPPTSTEIRLDVAKRQIYGRCKGFLELGSGSECTFKRAVHFRGRVKFTHRSIIEFLQNPEVEALMQSLTATFDPFDSICQTLLAHIKTIDTWHNDTTESILWLKENIHEIITLATRLGQAESTRWFSFLEAVPQLLYNFGPTGWDIGPDPATYIKLLALETGAHEYLKWSLKDNPRAFFNDKSGNYYGGYDTVIMCLFWRNQHPGVSRVTQRRMIATLDYCFSQGVSPNFLMGTTGQYSLWHQTLSDFIMDHEENNLRGCYNALPVIELFLRYGASPNFVLKVDALSDNYAHIFFFGDGVPIGGLLETLDGRIAPAKMRLPTAFIQKAERNKGVLALRDLAEFCVPTLATLLRELIDEASDSPKERDSHSQINPELLFDQEGPFIPGFFLQPESYHLQEIHGSPPREAD
ncbi:hypothetical protein F4779DRAFT_622212 [Xylariaceae sp. FL0662B]|nr:hypothetical protein F4779DRAFT_622212 [Xylariaceae sp. FL0662B]